jgi:hypothetical protein
MLLESEPHRQFGLLVIMGLPIRAQHSSVGHPDKPSEYVTPCGPVGSVGNLPIGFRRLREHRDQSCSGVV